MARTATARMRKDAEIIVKHNFGIGGPFSVKTEPYYGIAVFANRSGYRFLSEHFAWLAKRKVATGDSGPDPGDHVHLTPRSDLADEIDFTFDTITPRNRSYLLKCAGATKRSRRGGSPFRQLANYCKDSVKSFSKLWLKDDLQLRKQILKDLTEAITELEAARKLLLDE